MNLDNYRLDDLDRRLISALRTDGRAPISKLAAQLKVSRATVENRLNRLLASGAVLGFTLRLREDVDLEGIRAFISIEVAGKSTAGVIRALRGLPEIHALYSTNGAWDLVGEIKAASLGEFDRILREVRNIDGVLNSETSLLLSAV